MAEACEGCPLTCQIVGAALAHGSTTVDDILEVLYEGKDEFSGRHVELPPLER